MTPKRDADVQRDFRRQRVGQATADGRAMIEGLDTGWPTRDAGPVQPFAAGRQCRQSVRTAGQLARAETDFRLELDPFRLSVGRLRVDGLDAPVYLSGTLGASEEGWSLSLDGQMAQSRSRKLRATGRRFSRRGARQWFMDNVVAGQDQRCAIRAEQAARAERCRRSISISPSRCKGTICPHAAPVTDGAGPIHADRQPRFGDARQGPDHAAAGWGRRYWRAAVCHPRHAAKTGTRAARAEASGPITAALSYHRSGAAVAHADGSASRSRWQRKAAKSRVSGNAVAQRVRLPDMRYRFRRRVARRRRATTWCPGGR